MVMTRNDYAGIKCIVFDQDGTFYSANSHLAHALREMTKTWLIRKLNVSKHEIDLLYERLRENYPNPYHGFQSLGASVSEYHTEVFNTVNPFDYLTHDTSITAQG